MQTGTTVWCHDFDTNLKYGDSYDIGRILGREVQELQTALIKEGFGSVSLDSEKTNGEFGD